MTNEPAYKISATGMPIENRKLTFTEALWRFIMQERYRKGGL